LSDLPTCKLGKNLAAIIESIRRDFSLFGNVCALSPAAHLFSPPPCQSAVTSTLFRKSSLASFLFPPPIREDPYKMAFPVPPQLSPFSSLDSIPALYFEGEKAFGDLPLHNSSPPSSTSPRYARYVGYSLSVYSRMRTPLNQASDGGYNCLRLGHRETEMPLLEVFFLKYFQRLVVISPLPFPLNFFHSSLYRTV